MEPSTSQLLPYCVQSLQRLCDILAQLMDRDHDNVGEGNEGLFIGIACLILASSRWNYVYNWLQGNSINGASFELDSQLTFFCSRHVRHYMNAHAGERALFLALQCSPIPGQRPLPDCSAALLDVCA